jgi:hypothetical protein
MRCGFVLYRSSVLLLFCSEWPRQPNYGRLLTQRTAVPVSQTARAASPVTQTAARKATLGAWDLGLQAKPGRARLAVLGCWLTGLTVLSCWRLQLARSGWLRSMGSGTRTRKRRVVVSHRQEQP